MQLLKDGQIVESGVLSLGDAAPNKDIEVTIPYKTALDAGSEYFLNLSARLKKDCNWANAGHEVASEQYSLTGKIAVAPVDTAFNDTLKVEEEKGRSVFALRDSSSLSIQRRARWFLYAMPVRI